AQAINPQSPEAAAWLARLDADQAQMQKLDSAPGAEQGDAAQTPAQGPPASPDPGNSDAAPAPGD
ncbi:MAG: hypothetical protein HY342_03945, partial [Candidatus Lambdaproteobacteria bacterium]|nr:hypothetical protein [Candidatus Lambdaproteobacteria bacterium]